MNDQRSGRAGRALSKVAKARQKLPKSDVGALAQRVAELESEMQEARRLNLRVAELLDVVEELLVPLSLRDEEKVRQYLDSHSSAL